MPHYHIIPASAAERSTSVHALDAYATLNVMTAGGLTVAHIYEDGEYAFTARRATDDGGAWIIQTLPSLAGSTIPHPLIPGEEDFRAA